MHIGRIIYFVQRNTSRRKLCMAYQTPPCVVAVVTDTFYVNKPWLIPSYNDSYKKSPHLKTRRGIWIGLHILGFHFWSGEIEKLWNAQYNGSKKEIGKIDAQRGRGTGNPRKKYDDLTTRGKRYRASQSKKLIKRNFDGAYGPNAVKAILKIIKPFKRKWIAGEQGQGKLGQNTALHIMRENPSIFSYKDVLRASDGFFKDIHNLYPLAGIVIDFYVHIKVSLNFVHIIH